MKVSIITPFYKGEKYIKRLLYMIKDNAIECTNYNKNIRLEYIIVNDSPSINLNIANPYSEYFDLYVITNDENVGIHQTRVNGLKIATGEYIVFFDQDDVLYSNAIISGLCSIGNADVAIGNGYHVYDKSKEAIYKSRIAHRMATREIFYAYCTSMCVSPGHVLIKTNSIPIEWTDNILKDNGSDDFFLWLLLFDKKKKFTINSAFVYEHIGTGQNVSLNRKKMYESSLSFCNLAKNKQLISPRLLNKILRRTEMKIEWNFSADVKRKISLFLHNIDVFIVNIFYRMFYL